MSKSKCCRRYEKKGKPCKDCPKFEGLGKKKRRKLLKKLLGVHRARRNRDDRVRAGVKASVLAHDS